MPMKNEREYRDMVLASKEYQPRRCTTAAIGIITEVHVIGASTKSDFHGSLGYLIDLTPGTHPDIALAVTYDGAGRIIRNTMADIYILSRMLFRIIYI